MEDRQDFRLGRHGVSVRKVAGRWTAMLDGQPVSGFFGTEAQASGAALLTISGRERELDALGTGDTVSFLPAQR
jgi:hypothetical protein